MPLRYTHPNLFLGLVICGGWAIVNGVVMITAPSRMPDIMPATPVGVIYVVIGVAIVVGALERSLLKLARVALALSIVQSTSLAVGLFVGYGTVTASYDRPINYLAMALFQFAPLREPNRNPNTEIAPEHRGRRRSSWRR